MIRNLSLLLLLVLVPALIFTESMHSPTWGFFIDLPEGYEFTEGDGRSRFSFTGPQGLKFDIVVYDGRFNTIQDLVINVNRNLSNTGDYDLFAYYNKQAAIMELSFDNYSGYGICIELGPGETVPGENSARRPMMVALAYNPNNIRNAELFHFSALDSIAPSVSERLCPGPIMHYSFPRGELKTITLEDGIQSMIYENDAEAAQVLIEREFAVLAAYADTNLWQEAWFRYYRFIYRDSFDRIINPAFALASAWGGTEAATAALKTAFAQRALSFVQGFEFERNFSGSDFLNLVSAITEKRGDCDSRAMLWAILLACADIRAGMMVSRQYGHAMGLADIEGAGARFEAFGVHWLVAETTVDVDLGMIAQDSSDPRYWLGIVFE